MPDGARPCPLTGRSLRERWSPGHWHSFGTGPSSIALTCWPTGNEPGVTSPCSPYHRCRSMVTMSEKYLPVVAGVAVVGDHVLRLLFSDGTAGDVDFSAERWTGVLEPQNDPAFFARVIVDPDAGTLAWPNGIDLAPEPLYEQARAHPLIAA